MLYDSAVRLSNHCLMRFERSLVTTIIRLSGDFDLACDAGFQDQLEGVLDDRVERLVLDLRGLEFIDSVGLRALVQIDARARDDGFDFEVLCSDGQVREVLRLTGLDGVLSLIDQDGAVPASDSPV